MGYSVEQFFTEVDPNFICAICSEVFRDPVVLECEHVFCRTCVSTWLQNNDVCPIDRSEVHRKRQDQLKPASRLLLNVLNGLKVKCKYREHGCDEILKLEFLDEHERKCKCKATVPKGNLDEKLRSLEKAYNKELGSMKKRIEELQKLQRDTKSHLDRTIQEFEDYKAMIAEKLECMQSASELALDELMDEVESFKFKAEKHRSGSVMSLNESSSRGPERRFPSESSGRRNNMDALVNSLMERRLIRTEKIGMAMKMVDRKNYYRCNPYDDVSQPEEPGSHQYAKSPRQEALILENLASKLVPGAWVLQIGCRSSYVTACLALLVVPGKVVFVNQNEKVVESNRKVIRADKRNLYEQGTIELYSYRVNNLQFPDETFDVIQVDFYTDDVSEKRLLRLLKGNGRMINTSSRFNRKWVQYDKLRDGSIKRGVVKLR